MIDWPREEYIKGGVKSWVLFETIHWKHNRGEPHGIKAYPSAAKPYAKTFMHSTESSYGFVLRLGPALIVVVNLTKAHNEDTV